MNLNPNTTLLGVYLAPERAAVKQLRTLLSQYTSDSAGDEVLRRAVRAAVHELRDDAVPPEGVVVVLKALLDRARIKHPGRVPHAGAYEVVIKWGIEEYFGCE
jgi:hypothetical protein